MSTNSLQEKKKLQQFSKAKQTLGSEPGFIVEVSVRAQSLTLAIFRVRTLKIPLNVRPASVFESVSPRSSFRAAGLSLISQCCDGSAQHRSLHLLVSPHTLCFDFGVLNGHEHRTDTVLCCFTQLMAGAAFVEGSFVGTHILRVSQA